MNIGISLLLLVDFILSFTAASVLFIVFRDAPHSVPEWHYLVAIGFLVLLAFVNLIIGVIGFMGIKKREPN